MEPIDERSRTDQPGDEERNRRTALVAAAVVAVLVIALVVFLLTRNDDDDVTTGGTTTTEGPAPSTGQTSTSSSTSEPVPTTEGSTAPPATSNPSEPAGGEVSDDEAATIAWPDPGGGTTFSTPEAAAEAFAVDLVGFSDPRFGDFRAGDARSGEIDVRPVSTGPATTVLLRRMSDENWYVLGAVTAEIQVENPVAGTAIDDPLQVAGQARAFEGTVDVAVYERGRTEPLGTGFVTGSGGGAPGPFSGEISWGDPGRRWGVVVFSVASGEDGSTWQAAVVPVGFIGRD